MASGETQPSYLNGYAPVTGSPLYPEYWYDCRAALCGSLGITGQDLIDHSPQRLEVPGSGIVWEHRSDWVTRYNGSNSRHELPGNVKALSGTNGERFTLSVWAAHLIGGRMVLEDGTAFNTDSVYIFAATPTNVSFNLRTTVGNWNPTFTNAIIPPSGVPGVGEWNHYVLTYDGDVAKAYTNGNFLGSQSLPGGALLEGNANLRLGQRTNNSLTWQGHIDDFRLQGEALSETEVLQLFEIGRAGAYRTVPVNAGWQEITLAPGANGDGALVQSAQQISGSGTAVSPPTNTGSGALVQSAQEIAGVGTLDAPKRGVGTLVQTDQVIAGVGLHAALIDGDGQLVQTAQEISGTGVIISPGTKTGGAALIQTDQVIAGVGTKVSAPRMGVGALIQSQQIIVGRGFGEGFTQPVTDQVYTLSDANLYTISDRYVYT